MTVHPALDLLKGESDPRPGILGCGGPDMFGYRWSDSDESGGPTFDWVDISGVGTPIEFSSTGYCDDCNTGPIPLGFSFPFYGNTFSELRASTNGWFSFTNTTTDYSNDPLPSAGGPENLLAVFWDDLVSRNGTGSEPVPSMAYYYNDGTRFILQYENFYRIAEYDTDLTFEVILYPNGRIVYQYLTMDSGTLDSATIGTQNDARDDGLNIVYDMPYIHDSLAIEIASTPEWVTASPTGGVIPAGSSQDLLVSLNAMGLDDGVHEATIDLSSNDPYNPLVQVPVTLNVGVIAPTYLNFDPDVLNLSAPGNTVKMVIELPAGWDPHLIDVGSITLNDTVHANPAPVTFTDENNNGIEEIVVKFNRAAVSATLAEGSAVPVTVQFEITDVQWFRGTTTVRALRPHVTQPNGGEYYAAGQMMHVTWQAAPIGTPVTYNVYLSRDGGVAWEMIASNLSGTSYDWTVDGQPTVNARVRVVAVDSQGVVGYDGSDNLFTLATTLMPPNVIGDTLGMEIMGSDLMLYWKQPVSDLTHGPADHYRILASDSPQGPFVEIGTSTGESFLEPITGHSGTAIMYYKVLAANAAGNSLN